VGCPVGPAPPAVGGRGSPLGAMRLCFFRVCCTPSFITALPSMYWTRYNARGHGAALPAAVVVPTAARGGGSGGGTDDGTPLRPPAAACKHCRTILWSYTIPYNMYSDHVPRHARPDCGWLPRPPPGAGTVAPETAQAAAAGQSDRRTPTPAPRSPAQDTAIAPSVTAE
jgi:hypothetical protein